MSDKPSILLLDDERGTRTVLAKTLSLDYDVTAAADGVSGMELLTSKHFDLVLTDLRMPGADGFDVLKKTLELENPPLCIMLTAYGSIETAVKAMQMGAFDFVTKPIHLDQLDLVIRKALDSKRTKEENRELKKRLDVKFGLPSIVGNSKQMLDIIDMVRQVAPTRASVLIGGESGTGKELIAQALHQLSGRTGKFIAVHCAALTETLLESELFGHEKGAFTNALEMKRGRFELADKGTLFLDEIGEIPLATQVKLLRFLETRSFERVGGEQTIHVDTRIVAATNRDLKKMVEQGSFREDLFYRLNVVAIVLPPLRDRKDDIPLLVKHFLSIIGSENGKPAIAIDEPAMEALCQYTWPGNIRELRNCVERMVVLCRGNQLDISNVPLNIREMIAPGITKKSILSAASSCDLNHNEKLLIQRALNQSDGNRTQAAKSLGVSRRTLQRKIKEYGLE